MTLSETKPAAALLANVALRVQAGQLIAQYVEPQSDRAAILDDLIRLFYGPRQRDAKRLAGEALDEDPERIA